MRSAFGPWLRGYARDGMTGTEEHDDERLYGHDRALLQRQVRHVVLHELAHHFGISDERLREIGRY